MSTYPKLWPVGGHPEGEAKVRQLKKLGPKWLRASGSGWVAEKQGKLSNVKHGEEPEYVVVVWVGADSDAQQANVHPNPRHYWCFIDPKTKRVIGRGDLKINDIMYAMPRPGTTQNAHIYDGKLALTKGSPLGLETGRQYEAITWSNPLFDFWYDAEKSFNFDGSIYQYKPLDYFQYARLFSDTVDMFDQSAELEGVWRFKEDYFVIGYTFMNGSGDTFRTYGPVRWIGKFSAVDGLEKGLMARAPKALRWGQIQDNTFDILGDDVAAFAAAIAVSKDGVFVVKEPQAVDASEYGGPLEVVLLDHNLNATGVVLHGPFNHPYNTWFFNIEVSERYVVVHEQYPSYQDLPNGRMLIWRKSEGEWSYHKTLEIGDEFLPRPKNPAGVTVIYSQSPRVVSVFGGAMYWLRVTAGENRNNMVEFVWCSIETGECGKKRLDYEEDAEGNVVLDLRRDVVWYEGATLSLRADQVRKRRTPPRKLKRKE